MNSLQEILTALSRIGTAVAELFEEQQQILRGIERTAERALAETDTDALTKTQEALEQIIRLARAED
jgi:hypothetical protein